MARIPEKNLNLNALFVLSWKLKGLGFIINLENPTYPNYNRNAGIELALIFLSFRVMVEWNADMPYRHYRQVFKIWRYSFNKL